jgi:hypothetical protein
LALARIGLSTQCRALAPRQWCGETRGAAGGQDLGAKIWVKPQAAQLTTMRRPSGGSVDNTVKMP